MEQLKEKISQNINPYIERIPHMGLDEMTKMREDVKETRKARFRFSQSNTKDIPKDRIQLALSQLARLFRELNDEINQRNT
jgi:hypothetical protein